MRVVDRLAVARPVIAVGKVWESMTRLTDSRRPRPWTAMESVPLAIVATSLVGAWWAFLPLALCAWWWAERSFPWTWLVSVESGAFGTLWSYSGASALAEWPDRRALVGLVWIALPVALGVVSAFARSREGHLPHYPGY